MPNIDELLSWINDNRPTLFLDRDGVINKRIPGAYVEKVEQFNFFPNLAEHFKILNKFFSRVIVVTNQQGIGKELMTHEDLAVVHDYMLFEIEMNDGVVDAVYYCPELADFNPPCRKPNPGMALEAKTNFPDIDFKNSLIKWKEAQVQMKDLDLHDGKVIYHIQDLSHVTNATKRIKKILDAKYKNANLVEVVNECKHQPLLTLLRHYKPIFNKTLGQWHGNDFKIKLKEDAKPYYGRP